MGRALNGTGGQASTGGATDAQRSDPATPGRRLVKDPVCGMHIAEELALPATANGETQYFCSPECRAKFESSMVQRASA